MHFNIFLIKIPYNIRGFCDLRVLQSQINSKRCSKSFRQCSLFLPSSSLLNVDILSIQRMSTQRSFSRTLYVMRLPLPWEAVKKKPGIYFYLHRGGFHRSLLSCFRSNVVKKKLMLPPIFRNCSLI